MGRVAADISGDLSAREETAKVLSRALLKTHAYSKPIVAAVNGVAAGAGANIALACDIVVAAKSAKFIQSFAAIGLIWNSMMSVAGGWFFLMACEMFVLGNMMDHNGNALGDGGFVTTNDDKLADWLHAHDVDDDGSAHQCTSAVAMVYQAATNSGESSVQCEA